ncbi:MAG: AraC family transcriptional regulator, partial [Paenibacillaceae bacterium]|nr:AraC family transcriptional regulator [Paenibacillaceae bacterium]
MNQPHLTLSGYRLDVTLVHRWQRKEKFSSFESVHSGWLVFVVEDGSFHYRIGSEEGSASFGDLVFCPPQTVFRRVVISPVTLFVIFFDWRGWEEEPDMIPGQTAALPKGFPSGKISLHNTSRLISTLDLMRDAYLSDRLWKARKLAHYADDLWFQYCGEQGSPPVSLRERAPAQEDELVRE